MVEYCKTMFELIFLNVLEWFDTMMMDTGWIVWIGTVFLMIVGYRFIIRPLFGVFSLGDISGSSDSNKNYRRYGYKSREHSDPNYDDSFVDDFIWDGR